MQYISVALAVLVAIILIKGIVVLLRKPKKTGKRSVELPNFLAVVGIACCVVFLIIAIVGLILDGLDWPIVIFLACALLAETLIVAFINCRITYDDESFTARNFLGIKRRYCYNEITGIQGKSMDIKLHIGKRTVPLDTLALGKNEFLIHARKQYRKLNNGNAIPTVKPKADFIFNGNVENPGTHIFAYTLVSLFCVGSIVFLLIETLPKAPEDLDYASISFSQCEVYKHSLNLYVETESMFYRVPAYEELLTDAEKFLSLCRSGTTFHVGYTHSEDADPPFYRIESIIGADGTVFLTLDAINDYDRDFALVFGWMMGGIGLIWLIYVLISIYVGRHPEKFSRRFIRLFYKDEFIRIPDKHK